jgi:hypothetical protein
MHNFWRTPNSLIDSVTTLTLGSQPRQKGLARLWWPRGSLRVTSHALGRVGKCEGMNPHTPKATPTLGDGISVDFRTFREQLKGQKLNGLRSSLYHWKALKTQMSKWACMTHLDIWNTSNGQKKGRESNWQFDSRPLKVGNRPNFVASKWCATYHWKDLNKDYNFVQYLISIEGLHVKLWGPKVTGIPNLTISGLPLGRPETKCHLDVGFVEKHKIYYKGEGGGMWWLTPSLGHGESCESKFARGSS